MSVRFYDEALTEKIKKWIKDPNLMILRPDETTRLFSTLADLKEDKPITLPVIAISRARDITVNSTAKQPRTFDGFVLQSNQKISIPINVIPITLRYQIDIYTKTMDEADEYIRNLLFNFVNYPTLQITLPYNDCNIKHNFLMYLDDTITDNSDITEHKFPDQFTRFTMSLTIVDAYMFSLPVKNNTTIEYEFKVEGIDEPIIAND